MFQPGEADSNCVVLENGLDSMSWYERVLLVVIRAIKKKNV